MDRGAPFAKSFEQDLSARVGFALYDKLFRPIAEKLWGDPLNLNTKLSQGRVQIPNVFEIILGTLGLNPTSSFEALEFSYPKGGLKMLWQAISRNISSNGKILVDHAVQKLTCDTQGNM